MQAVWMILSAFLIASMGVCVKFASAYFTGAELVFYRGVVSMVFMAAYAQVYGTSLRTRCNFKSRAEGTLCGDAGSICRTRRTKARQKEPNALVH